MNDTLPDPYYPGLEGVIAGQTAISNIVEREVPVCWSIVATSSRTWCATPLMKRPRSCSCMAICPRGRSFGRLTIGCAVGDLPAPLVKVLEQIPADANPMDVLLNPVSLLAHFDPDRNAPPTDHAVNVRKAERMIARMPTAIALRDRVSTGLRPVEADPGLGHAANFLKMVKGAEPSEPDRRAFNASLVIYAEHELNASTFAARATVSTLSDIYSGIVAAVGTLKGPLHGGANEEAWKLLESVGSPDAASGWIDGALARHERIMGFGHRVYKRSDPCAAILKDHCRELARNRKEDRWEQIAESIERAVVGRKKLPANVDWPSAALPLPWLASSPLHADLRHGPGSRLGRTRHRAN